MQQSELLQRLAALEEEVSALKARAQIENLVSRYQHYRTAGQWERLLSECWADSRDISAEVGPSGIFLGLESLGNYYRKYNLPGRLTVHALTAPNIVVHRDGTAQGLWLSIGSESDAGELGSNPIPSPEAYRLLTSRDPQGRAYRAEWVWQKFSARFVRQKDGWRIQHLHIYEIFRCPFHTDWVRFSTLRHETDGLRCDALFTPEIEPDLPEGFPREFNPQLASSFHWQYSPQAVPVLQPPPPDSPT